MAPKMESVMPSDHTIKENITAELNWEPMIIADHIGVAVRDGLVTLSGHVETYGQKSAAERAAGRVKGVKAIAEEIEVRLPPHILRSDEEIAAAAVNRLEWDSAVPIDAVKVVVQGGHVTLSGSVPQYYQRRAAAWAVQPLWGVLSVANQIAVTGPVKAQQDPSQIATDIRRALGRTWFGGDTVTVAAADGIVTLTGHTENLHDRKLAAATAWAAPGTRAVENHIRIS
jgi:osmotically-inducible protein OsmY